MPFKGYIEPELGIVGAVFSSVFEGFLLRVPFKGSCKGYLVPELRGFGCFAMTCRAKARR